MGNIKTACKTCAYFVFSKKDPGFYQTYYIQDLAPNKEWIFFENWQKTQLKPWKEKWLFDFDYCYYYYSHGFTGTCLQ